jgi:hypothetical protein
VLDANSGAGLAGWVVSVTGPTTMSTTTDANGNYLLSGLVAGTYVVCEAVQSGWSQVSPMFPASCASGFGYDFTLTPDGSAQAVNFRNQQP